jgi:hypothetical protein
MRKNKRKNLSGWKQPTKQEFQWMRNNWLVAYSTAKGRHTIPTTHVWH